ncbi:hypothetical protein [Micromonospora sp. NPDC002717]
MPAAAPEPTPAASEGGQHPRRAVPDGRLLDGFLALTGLILEPDTT